MSINLVQAVNSAIVRQLASRTTPGLSSPR